MLCCDGVKTTSAIQTSSQSSKLRLFETTTDVIDELLTRTKCRSTSVAYKKGGTGLTNLDAFNNQLCKWWWQINQVFQLLGLCRNLLQKLCAKLHQRRFGKWHKKTLTLSNCLLRYISIKFWQICTYVREPTCWNINSKSLGRRCYSSRVSFRGSRLGLSRLAPFTTSYT